MYCLIVDDNVDALFIARKLVANLGFLTRTAKTGTEALATAKTHLPLLVLLDWHMPDMSGLEFIDQLKRIRGAYKVPVVMCTGESNEQKVKAALDRGAKGYLLKPFSEGDVVKQFGHLKIWPS